VAALVVVVKEPMLLLHYMSLTFFYNEAQSTALSSSHDFHLCKSRSIQSSAAEAAPLQVVVRRGRAGGGAISRRPCCCCTTSH